MSPKELFQNDAIKADYHRRLMTDSRVREALLVALNEHNWNLPVADNPQTSWAANARRQGAQDFLKIFLALANPPSKRETMQAGKLEYEDATTSRIDTRKPGQSVK
jgi:hypothetical protein